MFKAMASGDFDSVPSKCVSRDRHFLIRKLALLLDNPISQQETNRQVILVDELLIATSFGFYACDLAYLIKILQHLADNIATTPIYKIKLQAILNKCLIPPILRKASDVLECRMLLQEFLSSLAYLLLTLYDDDTFYNLIIDILYNLLIRNYVEFPPCCVSHHTCVDLLMQSDLPRVLGHLTSIAGNDCYFKLLDLTDVLLDRCKAISISLVEVGIVDHILLRLVSNVDNYINLNSQNTFQYIIIDNVNYISGFLLKLLIFLRGLPKDQTKHLKPPDVTSMWCFRYTFKYFVRNNLAVLYRNNLMTIILIWLEMFDNFLFVHSGLADDVYLLCSSDLELDKNHEWASQLKWSSAPLDYRFKQMLLYSIWFTVQDRTYAAVLQNYKIVPCLLELLTPTDDIIWLPEQYRKLSKITLSCLEKMFRHGIGIKDFIKYNGTPRLLKILMFHKDAPKNSSMIFACCKTMNAVLELQNKVIFISMIKGGILDILLSITKGYLKMKLFVIMDKTALALTILILARIYKHYKHFPVDLNEILLHFFSRIKANEHDDFIQDPRCVIASLQLLQATVMELPDVLVSFAEHGGVYLLLDILTTACYPVRLNILTIIVDLCEIEHTISYLLTWRSKGKTLMHQLVQIFKEDILSVGANVDQRCVIQNVERPLISKRQWEETIAKNKYTNFSPVIIDMIGNCQPKIYAILHLLKFKNIEATSIIIDEYKVWTEELDAKDRIVLVLCENYMKIKVGEAWMEIQKDIQLSGFIPMTIDNHLLHLVKQHHLLWNQRLKHIQEKILLESENAEYKREVDFYEKIKTTKLTLSLESLLELQYIAETSDSIFKQMRKLHHRDSLVDEPLKLHKTYMSYFNVNAVCNQKIIIETDKLVESKKDWETDFSDLKEISPNESSSSLLQNETD